MKVYEGMFLVDSRRANRDWDSVVSHLNGTLEKCGVTVHSLDKWAERKLAYPISRHTRGVYVLTYFETSDEREETVDEIYRQVEISDTVLRAMILRIPQIPPKEPAEDEPPADKKAAAEATDVKTLTEDSPGDKQAPEETPAQDAADQEDQATVSDMPSETEQA